MLSGQSDQGRTVPHREQCMGRRAVGLFWVSAGEVTQAAKLRISRRRTKAIEDRRLETWSTLHPGESLGRYSTGGSRRVKREIGRIRPNADEMPRGGHARIPTQDTVVVVRSPRVCVDTVVSSKGRTAPFYFMRWCLHLLIPTALCREPNCATGYALPTGRGISVVA